MKTDSPYDPTVQFMHLLGHLPNICFFAKDKAGNIISASAAMVRRYGLQSLEELTGKNDRDFFPAHIAKGIVDDDQMVMTTGKPILGRVEVLFDENRILDWYTTNKFPLYALDGSVVGVMGTTHSLGEKRGTFLANARISKAVERIQTAYAERLTIGALAALSGLSERQFRRQFQEVFEMSPQEFIHKTRVQAGCKLLKQSDAPIANVATDCGFCDQSSFTHYFRRYLGITPLQFRKGLLAGAEGL
jgi:AraC-type DNA-binding domain-containing proteins